MIDGPGHGRARSSQPNIEITTADIDKVSEVLLEIYPKAQALVAAIKRFGEKNHIIRIGAQIPLASGLGMQSSFTDSYWTLIREGSGDGEYDIMSFGLAPEFPSICLLGRADSYGSVELKEGDEIYEMFPPSEEDDLVKYYKSQFLPVEDFSDLEVAVAASTERPGESIPIAYTDRGIDKPCGVLTFYAKDGELYLTFFSRDHKPDPEKIDLSVYKYGDKHGK